MAVDPRSSVLGVRPSVSTASPLASPLPRGEGQGEEHPTPEAGLETDALQRIPVGARLASPSLNAPNAGEASLAPTKPRSPLAPEASASQPAGGHHLLVDFWVRDAEPLRRVATWETLLPDACRDAGATVLGARFHQFEPEGVTGIVLLAESHASLHTWPEAGLVTLDVFTCGALDAHAIVDRIRDAIAPVRERITAVARGDRAADSARSARGPASGETMHNDASGVPSP